MELIFIGLLCIADPQVAVNPHVQNLHGDLIRNNHLEDQEAEGRRRLKCIWK
jgi:hypothetical protein